MSNEEAPARMNMQTCLASAREMSGCSKKCNIELTYCGVVDGAFYSFYMTHNNDGQNVQVSVGTSVVEMYKALGRSLKEMAGHAN